MHIQVHIVIQTNTGIYIQNSYIHTYMYRYDYIWIVELHMHIQTYTDIYMHIWTIYTHTDIWTIYAFQCKCICACILLVYTCTIHAYMNQRFHMSTYEPAGSLMGTLGSLLQHSGLPSPLGSTTPHSTLPATARPHSRLPNRLGSPHPARHGSAAQDPFPALSPLLCLSVLSTPARAPSLLSLADLLRVARLTVSCSPVSPGRDRTTHHGLARSGLRRARVWHTTPEWPDLTRLGLTCLHTRPDLFVHAAPARPGSARLGPARLGSARPSSRPVCTHGPACLYTRPSRTGSHLLAHVLTFTQCTHISHLWTELSASLDCAARVAVSRGQWHRIDLSRQPKGRVRTAIGGVSYLFCLGMVRPDGPPDPISGRDVKWDLK